MRRRIDSQAGQTASEYLGILLLVGMVIFALASLPVPGRIAGEVERLVCEIAGGDCSAQAEEPPPDEPEETPEQRRARELGSSEQGEPPPGTPDERARTDSPLPPDGDQCSTAPDVADFPGTDWRLYDFSYACYGHDVCWQNGTYDGEAQTIGSCNEIFEDLMRDHCDRRWTGFGSGTPENACFRVADVYREAVDWAGLKKASEDCPELFTDPESLLTVFDQDYIIDHCRPEPA